MLIVLIVGLMLFGFVGFIFIGMMDNADKKVQQNADKILDNTFDGSETATYKVVGFGGTLKFEQVLKGAEQRGYELHAQNQDNENLTTLVFKKAA